MPQLNPDDDHAIIETKIREHENAIQELKSTRNAFTYVSQLPAEVLSMIFIQVKHEHSIEYDDEEDKVIDVPFNLGWMKVSAVCRHWRHVSLDTLCLWTDINFGLGDVDYIEETLKRSKTAPLDLVLSFADTPHACDINRKWDLAVHAVSTKNLKSISLHTEEDSGSILRLLESHGNRPSLLQSLKLNCDNWMGPAISVWSDMSALRTLEVLGIPLPGMFPLFPNLKVLLLDPPEDHPLSVSYVLRVLRSAPFVHDVCIREICENDGFDSSCLPSVKLPALKYLLLGFNSLESTCLLDYLCFPASGTCVTFEMNFSPPEALGRTAISHIQPVWARFVDVNHGLELDTRILPECDSFSILFRKLNPEREDFEFVITAGHNFPFLIFAPLFAKATSLELIDPVTYDLWHSILPSFTNVKTMTLAMFDLKILEIITPSIGSESATELPKLETLILSGYTFGNSANDLLSFMTDPTPLSVLLGLRRIDTVKVVDSLVTLDLVDQFRNRKTEIEWGNTTILDTRPVRDAFKAFYTELLCKLEG